MSRQASIGVPGARPRQVLLVDGEVAAREALQARFRPYEGEFRVLAGGLGVEALGLTSGGKADAVLLAARLPDMAGSELCRRLRRAGFAAPIIMLGATEVEAEIIAGLDAGADDYIARPFQPSVLIARLRAQLRHCGQPGGAVQAMGPYLFHPATRQLVERASGRKIRLTAKEAAMLRYFQANGGRAVSRDSLMRQVWGYNSEAVSHTIETHVYRLRRKLEPAPGSATLLESVPGGYRLALDAPMPSPFETAAAPTLQGEVIY
jgi:DNA-binding response OmpR family regulator